MTASALTEPHNRGTPTPNRLRDGPTYHNVNVGMLTIDWSGKTPAVHIQVIDVNRATRIEKRFAF